MAVTNPFSITYGSREVGGTTNYLLHGPYEFSKSFDSISVSFDVVVVGASYADLQNLSDALEIDFRKRDQDLVIDLDNIDDAGGASTWIYTNGTTILNTVATLSKSGDPETDRGFSRMYSCTIEGELPADDASPVTGLRDISFSVGVSPSRQRIVTMQGTYTATAAHDAVPAQLASVNYLDTPGADAEATTFLTALDSGATFELGPESFEPDRQDHTATFTRQYVELLVNQTAGALDATDIRDHQVKFTQVFQQPGDSEESLYRLRRVIGNYDCAVDIDQTTDLQAVFDNQIRAHVLELFRSSFNPKVLCIEDQNVSYDETTKRMSVAITFLYQTPEGDDKLEMTTSLTQSTTHTLDYTPVHNGDEFAAYVDRGFGEKIRIFTRTGISIGSHMGGIGSWHRKWGKPLAKGGTWTGGVVPDAEGAGWNTISSSFKFTPMWIGDPSQEQIHVTIGEEEFVQRWNSDPSGAGVRRVDFRLGAAIFGAGLRGGG